MLVPLSSALRTATRSALCAVGLAGIALAADATPAAAARPHHKAAHAAHTGASRHGAALRSAGHAASHAIGRHKSASKRAHASTHAGRRHHERPRTAAELADLNYEPVREAPPITLPQFALPDLAVSATTYPAGRTLGGFGGPTETAMVPTSATARTLAALTHSAASLLDALVSRARGQLGTRYVFGGAEPGAGLDCSSFARYAMEALGVRLPRTANQQAQIGRAIPRDPSLLRPGDLLTFGSPRHVSHVGIYLGQGRFIHASVSHGQVIETTIDRNRSLFRHWQGARRLVASVNDSTDDRSVGG